MKKLLLALFLVGAMVGSIALMARGDQDFVLVNKTGLTIDKVFVSPANESHWGEDILGKDTLDNNEKVTITFPHKETECIWDLKVVDEEKDDIIWEDLNLCKAKEITLKYEGKHPTAIIR